MTVLDTNILIYLLEGRLAEPLPREGLCVSVITEIELLAHPKVDAKVEESIRALLQSVAIIGLTPPIKEEAIRIRRSHGLTIPDAVIAATAASLGAELWTNDGKLAATPNLRSRTVALRE